MDTSLEHLDSSDSDVEFDKEPNSHPAKCQREDLSDSFKKSFIKPLTAKRCPQLDSYDKTILCEKVGKGARQRWRRAHHRNKEPVICDEQYVMTSVSLWDTLTDKFFIKCRRCNVGEAKYSVEGKCTARFLELKCNNCGNAVKDKPDEKERIYVRDLKMAYVSMLTDLGFTGYEMFLTTLGSPHAAKSTFYRHADKVYDLMKAFHEEKQSAAIEEIKQFYLRKGSKLNDDGTLDIVGSLDGSYPRRGHFSLYCLSYLYESYTGSTIDFVMTERCTTCPNREHKGTHCPRDLFHGTAQNLEGENALKLFEMLKKHKLRVKVLVCDGDSKVHGYIEDFYGTDEADLVIKEECTNHFVK